MRIRVGRKSSSIYVYLLAANAAVWLWACIAFSSRPALLGVALLAYTFGMRHAFDADHIAAIDNVVRKLVKQGKACSSVGLFFSLGHSTVVTVGCIVFVVAGSALHSQLEAFHERGSIIGTAVSAGFLLIIGVANLFSVADIVNDSRRMRRGELSSDEHDALISGHGMLTRLLRPVFSLVSNSWHMYPIGILFGLGFDTATEVGLLSLTAKQAATGLSFTSSLIFPALFAAGMSLLNSADSALIRHAYAGALVHPDHRFRYNLAITAISAALAIGIGSAEASALIGDKFKLQGSFWSMAAKVNDNLPHFGYAITALLFAGWLFSITLSRIRRLDNA